MVEFRENFDVLRGKILLCYTSSESGAEDQLLARLEGTASAPAADKRECFLQDHISDLPTPEHTGLSLENAVALLGLEWTVSDYKQSIVFHQRLMNRPPIQSSQEKPSCHSQKSVNDQISR